MINSMTGYGSADGTLDGVTYAVEVKTVNNRYFKTKIKLPESIAFLEEDIERLLRQNLSRGFVDYSLELKNISADVFFNIDEKALKSVVERLQHIAGSVGIDSPVDISSLLMLPGMMSPLLPDKKKAENVKKAVLDITAKAIDSLRKMRATEGQALAVDIDSCCKALTDDLERVRNRKSVVIDEYRKKLKKRVDGLLAEGKLELDEDTLSREVAILADRSDISEEIARMDSHLQQFSESCAKEGQAGRRLDFIAQEMLREANTIASKSFDSEIVSCVVDMKCQIDRIKEQVQNIE